MLIWLSAGLIIVVALIAMKAPSAWWIGGFVLWLTGAYFNASSDIVLTIIVVILVGIPATVLLLSPLRIAFVTAPIFNLFKRISPSMSDTERDALEAGTTWWDAELFTGKPDWNKLLSCPAPTLTPEEQSFLDNEVNTLCAMVPDWETTQIWQDLPPLAWKYIRDNGFLGMIIPKQYGGKQFSAYMHSQVVMKLSSRCSALAVSVMVPNSLGPAELLLHYGTDEQKDYYLPRLAAGVELPCFALTSPYAGSDASGMPDLGVVCKETFEGRETLGLRVTWNKRYITLGPIATLLGLAFQTRDPERLLGAKFNLGITCALIPTSHPGVVTGRRHWPLNAVFQNGPTSGNNVFIPLDWVIGGRQQVGNGWRMVMECLAAGRAISLPSTNVGMAKLAVRGTSAYAAVRRQFNTPIGKFEGVQEALARMGGNLYLMDATRQLSAVAVDMGEKPAVISAIAKYHVTERGRQVVNDGMDVLGGKGICMGPANFLARAYQQIPIGITVEGANILTRCLIIFGQGAIRSHPYVLSELSAVQMSDYEEAVESFDEAFFGHMEFVFRNYLRAVFYGITAAYFAPVPSENKAAPEMHKYYKALGRISTVFAVLTDLSMFVLGSELKRRERISARLGDVLAQMYLISAVLKRFEDDQRPADDAVYVHWSIQDALVIAQDAIIGVLDNFPIRWMAVVLRLKFFPFGMPYRAPSDALGAEVAHAMQTGGAGRNRLLADSYVQGDAGDAITRGEMAFNLLPIFSELERRLKPAIASGALTPMPQSPLTLQPWLKRAAQEGYITGAERNQMLEYARLTDLIIQVDDFEQDFQNGDDELSLKLPVQPASRVIANLN